MTRILRRLQAANLVRVVGDMVELTPSGEERLRAFHGNHG
jgi:Mn-dependent DtxR family transcriptional regulator